MGCPWTGRRSTLKDTHVPLCPYEAIKGFFSIHQQREEAMRQENLRLQQKVDTLQGVVNVMKRELSIGQEALGPWYRSAQTRINLPRTGGGGSFSSGFALEGSRSPSSQFSSNVASDIVSPPPAAHFNDPTEALASYFPDQIDGFMPREYPLVDSRGSGPSTMFTPHMLTPQHPTPPLRPPPISTPYIYPAPTLSSTPSSSSTPTSNTTITTTVHNALSLGSTVAPLNLSGTLEGSLSGLRESIVTVSAAVDSLGRQHEVAVTTEAMRMNEEVRSLRAVVQGLRMQVCVSIEFEVKNSFSYMMFHRSIQ